MTLLRTAGYTVFALASATALMLSAGPSALAQDSAVSTGKGDTARFESLMPRSGGAQVSYGAPEPTSGDTHPTIQLTPDKSELIRLDADATSIIVGNGEHLGAIAENSRLVILVPRQPGATYLTILDAEGKVLMQRHVLVATPKEKYVRVRRTCAADNEACEATTVYYCPDMCHRVGLVEPAPDIVSQPAVTMAISQETADTAREEDNPDSDAGE